MSGLALGAALTGGSLSPLTWYLARASGLTLYLLLWLSVVSGLGIRRGCCRHRADLADVGAAPYHSDLSIILLVLHLVSLALDRSVSLGILGVLVPFVSDVRQPWTDLGIVAGYGMIAVSASFNIRHLIGWRAWRWLHVGSLPLWLIALAHGIGAGSEAAASGPVRSRRDDRVGPVPRGRPPAAGRNARMGEVSAGQPSPRPRGDAAAGG